MSIFSNMGFNTSNLRKAWLTKNQESGHILRLFSNALKISRTNEQDFGALSCAYV